MVSAGSGRMMARKPAKGANVVTKRPHSSISTLHKQWAKLEDEHHQLAIAINEARTAGTDLAPMRQRQIELLLEITSIVAEIRDAPATTPEDFIACSTSRSSTNSILPATSLIMDQAIIR
jgi:hypothetical protein